MPPFEMPESLDGLSADALAELRAAAQAHFASLAETAETDEDVAAIEALAANVQAIDTRAGELATAATARAERIATALAAVTPAEVVEIEIEAAVEEVIAEAEAVVEAEVLEGTIVAAVTPAPVTRAPGRMVARSAPAPKVAPVSKPGVAIVAAAGVPGFRGGQEVSLLDMVKPMMSRFSSYVGVSHAQDELFQLRTPARDERLVAGGKYSDQEVIEYAVNQARVKNPTTGETGILAAGGWCAPAEQRFDICTLAELDGILDVPTISMPRGSLSYFRQLDYSTVATAIAAGEFTFTNAELIVDPPVVKPCFEIPCATPVDATLDVVGLCLRAGLLQQKAFPELIAAWMELSLIAFAHYRNARNIAQMVAGSGAALVSTPTFGAISAFLDALALRAINYRFDNGMAADATLEIVVPFWLPDVLWADKNRRQFGSETSYTRAALVSDLAEINIRAQFVKDFQDAPFAGGAAVTTWPATVNVLMYAPGAWVRGSEDVISVSSLVDSTLLQTNRTQLLFFEAADVMLPMCGPSILLTLAICPSGATAGPIASTPGVVVCPAD